jgi:tetratricopeptide (TPR) repeat protein
MRILTYSILLLLFFSSCNQRAEKRQETTQRNPTSSQYGVLCAPEVIDKSWYSSGKQAPLFSGLGGIHFPVSTKSAKAQQYFDQGLMLSFGFNHAEAARSFYEATRQDSTCAMCWWGFAFVLGPNYNAGMEKDNFQRAFDAVQKAKALSASSTPKEKDLIDALTHRYSNDTTIARAVLDSSFAASMRKVYNKYSDDASIASLYAESMMNLHPWNLWTKDGTIQPWTPEILKVLEKSLKTDPKHPGANHFYIHATEMSAHAESALASADLLMDLVPGSGHLVHMPSHTYIRIGRYHDGVVSNQKAAQVDSLYTAACHAQGMYPLAYFPHNYHFLAACAALSGESKAAMIGAKETANHAHKSLLLDPAWGTLQHYYSIPWYMEIKLGLWKEILNAPTPEKELKYPSVIWHYARGMASLAQNKPAEAKKNLANIKAIMQDKSLKDLSIWGINSVFDLCLIAAKTLEGEIHAKEKKYASSIALLKEAIAQEDALNYNEPPDWFFSVRHHLGAVLIEAGKYQEAIAVYQQDLKIYPENGWALKGMMNAYEKLGDKKSYKQTKLRFEKAWKYADIEIATSRIL